MKEVRSGRAARNGGVSASTALLVLSVTPHDAEAIGRGGHRLAKLSLC